MKKTIVTSMMLIASFFGVIKITASPIGNGEEGFGFGVKTGLNLTSMMTKSYYDPSAKAGFHVGLIGEYRMNDFSIQPELLLSQKHYSLNPGKVTFNNNPWYIDIPIFLQYNLALGDDRLFIGAGPVMSFGIFGKTNYTDKNIDLKYDYFKHSGGDANTFDLGAAFHVGYQLYNGLFAEIGVNVGFFDQFDNIRSKNYGTTLSVGYRF